MRQVYCCPLKVLGGQHRGEAIKRAVQRGRETERLHGVRVYFGLSATQRVELVIIANSNIAIPNPLLDRIAEHQLGGSPALGVNVSGYLNLTRTSRTELLVGTE